MSRLELRNLSKQYGSQVALRNVSLSVEPGEVHALVGENGAGKSTLVKILSGAIRRDAGEMLLDRDVLDPQSPLNARRAGVAMVYQELALAPHLSVEDNLMLGMEWHTAGWLHRSRQRESVRDALATLDHADLPPDTLVGLLSPGMKQVVEIARAIVHEARVVIFDEPTSSLTHDDVQKLFSLIDKLKQQGTSIVYISHFLEEVQRVADRYTVLRNGESVASGDVKTTPVRTMIEQMIGRPAGELYPRVPHQLGEPLLEVNLLAGHTYPREISFSVRQGEIMGLFGLVGAGRTETLRALAGLDPSVAMAVTWNEESLLGLSASQRLQNGVGLLSEDRKTEGLSIKQSLEENLTLSHLKPYLSSGFLDWQERSQATDKWLNQFNVRHRETTQAAAELSGGNQQKLALARLFHQGAELLLLDEPTKGVDIGSKQEIYRLIGEQAALGKTFIVVSSYLPELFGMCDTMAVLVRGKLSEKKPIDEWTPASVMALATALN